jgi:hypothetical protein
MSKLYLPIAVICAFLITVCHGEIKLGNNTVVVFATVDQGKQILTTRDDFIQRLSPFDRAARLKTDKEVPETEFLNFVGQNVLAWTDSDKQKVNSAFESVQANLEAMSLSFPKTVYMVKTTGNEEGHAAYTRSNAIVFPQNQLKMSKEAVEKLICHELFHILTRANPQLREQLYEIIGFTKCNEIEFPPNLKSRKITNPDAPANDHCILIQYEGKAYWAVPILFSNTEKYDVTVGGEFFDYLVFQLLLAQRSSDSNSVKPLYDGPNPRIVDTQKVSGFFEKVGMNTQYIIHPEEILADNFASLVLEEHNMPSPEILKKMKDVLTKKSIAESNAPSAANKQNH